MPLTCPFDADQKPSFELLQIRPMAVNQYNLEVEIGDEDISKAFCYSTMALGNGQFEEIEDIVFVNPATFDAAHTIEIATEIGNVNKRDDPAQPKIPAYRTGALGICRPLAGNSGTLDGHLASRRYC